MIDDPNVLPTSMTELFAAEFHISDERRRAAARVIWRMLEPRGYSRDDFIDLIEGEEPITYERIHERFEQLRARKRGDVGIGRDAV